MYDCWRAAIAVGFRIYWRRQEGFREGFLLGTLREWGKVVGEIVQDFGSLGSCP